MAQITTPALIGLIITASLLVIINDWPLAFGALAIQYVFAAALISQIVVWQVSAVKLAVGMLIIVILLITGRQVNFGRRPVAKATTATDGEAAAAPQASRFEFPTGLPFRFMAVVMIVVAAWSTASRPGFSLPGLPLGLNVASYLLMALGLLNLGLTEEPMNAGLGLLTVLSGFEVLYAAVEPSLAIVALLAAVNFGVALAVSYLALLRYSAASSRESSG